MNDLYFQEWSQFTNHFKPTFKLLKRRSKAARPSGSTNHQPLTLYQRLLASADIPDATKTKLPTEHAA
jgi:hypothetical protein